MFETIRRVIRFIPAMAGSLVLFAPVARASDISFLDAFANTSYEQTGNGNALSLNGYFFYLDLNSTVPNAYTSASVTYPGPGSPQSLSNSVSAPSDYSYESPYLPSLADYPFGTYTYSGTNGGGTDMASYDYTANDYPQSNPYLTGTDYTSLQGMSATQPFTFDFSPFVTGSTANESYIFLTIYDYTTSSSVNLPGAGFLSPSTTSYVLAANTLTPGNSYGYEIIYDNRDDFDNSVVTNTEFGAQLAFDLRTDGTFTTSPLPEPSSYAALLAAAFVGFVILRRRRNAAGVE